MQSLAVGEAAFLGDWKADEEPDDLVDVAKLVATPLPHNYYGRMTAIFVVCAKGKTKEKYQRGR